MVNIILKRYMASAIKWIKRFQNNQFLKARLMLTALLVFALSVFLGILTILVHVLFIKQMPIEHPIVYSLTQSEFAIDLELDEDHMSEEDELLHELQEVLLGTMLLVDLIMILLSILPLYLLVRRLLRPIEEMTQQQNRLIADVSHELRTPLAVMLSGVESALLNKSISRPCTEILQSYIKDISYLKGITDDILTMEEYASEPKKEPCDMVPICEASIAMVAPYAKERGIQCIFTNKQDASVLIYAHKIQMQRLLLNILKNAIDYSDANAVVHLTLRDTGKFVEISLRDNGIGMSEKDQKNILKRFYKADTSRGSSGSGLGLSIVQSIIETHDAQLKIKSSLGNGTTIIVRIPILSS